MVMSGKRRWTHEEDETLREMWGTHPIDSICAKLGRSRDAIAVRKTKLKLGRFYDASEYITVNRLHKILSGKNVNSYQLISWVQNRGLPIMNKTRGPGYKVRCIHLKDFWKWAEKNRDFIDFSKFERNSLGPEPDWVAAQRKFDEQKKTVCDDDALDTCGRRKAAGDAETVQIQHSRDCSKAPQDRGRRHQTDKHAGYQVQTSAWRSTHPVD